MPNATSTVAAWDDATQLTFDEGMGLFDVRVLRGLDGSGRSELSRVARWGRFEAGRVLVGETSRARPSTGRPGPAADDDLAPPVLPEFVVAVTQGWCTAVRSQPDGSRAIVGICGAGELAGVERLASAGCDDRPASPAWVAAGPMAGFRLPVGAVRRAVECSPSARADLERTLAARVFELEELMVDRLLGTEERLHRALVRLASLHGVRFGGARSIPVPLTQGVLGALIGTTRETVNRALRRLAGAGLILLHEGRPVVVRTAPAPRDVA